MSTRTFQKQRCLLLRRGAKFLLITMGTVRMHSAGDMHCLKQRTALVAGYQKRMLSWIMTYSLHLLCLREQQFAVISVGWNKESSPLSDNSGHHNLFIALLGIYMCWDWMFTLWEVWREIHQQHSACCPFWSKYPDIFYKLIKQ